MFLDGWRITSDSFPFIMYQHSLSASIHLSISYDPYEKQPKLFHIARHNLGGWFPHGMCFCKNLSFQLYMFFIIFLKWSPVYEPLEGLQKQNNSLVPLYSYHAFTLLTVGTSFSIVPILPLPANSHLVNLSSLRLFGGGRRLSLPRPHFLRELLLNKSDFLPTNSYLLRFGFWLWLLSVK